MGYSHNWKLDRKLTQTEFNDITKGFKQLLDTFENLVGAQICDPIGTPGSKPEITKTALHFNGCRYPRDDERGDESHESFIVAPDVKLDEFCKTARKPYDSLVCATLLLMRHVTCFEMVLKSDGHVFDDEWLRALGLYCKTFKYDVRQPSIRQYLRQLCGRHVWMDERKQIDYIGRVVEYEMCYNLRF